jgi:hypothetical protein
MSLFLFSCSGTLTLMTDTLKSDVQELKNRGDVIVSVDSVKKAGFPIIYTIKYRERD